jgi:putative membrane protein
MEFLVHLLVTAGLLLVTARVVPGIQIRDAGSAVIAALLLGFANAFVRPLVIFLTLPLTVVTLGLFLWVVNGLMLLLTATLVEGFRVRGVGTAMLGSLVLGLLGMAARALLGI